MFPTRRTVYKFPLDRGFSRGYSGFIAETTAIRFGDLLLKADDDRHPAVFFRLYTMHTSSLWAGDGGDTREGMPDALSAGSPTLSFARPPRLATEGGSNTQGSIMPASTTPASSPAKPDYRAPSFRGALMNDHWILDDEAGLATIPADLIGDVSRASNAIMTISRILHNSLCEPDMSGAEPLGKTAHLGLLDAAELVGKYLDEIADRMNEAAQCHAKFEQSKEKNHG